MPEDEEQFINIRNQATLSMLGTFLDAAVSFVGLVLFANILGAGGLGKFYVLLAIVKLSRFPLGGIGQAVMKRGSERNLNTARFFGGGITYCVAYVTTCGGILLAIALIDTELFPYDLKLVATAFALFVVQLFYHLSLDTYRSYGKTGYAGLIDNTLGILETALQVVLLLTGFGVLGLLIGTIVMTTLVTIGLLIFSTVTVARPDTDVLRSIWRYGRWSVITSGLANVYDRLPLLLVGAFLGNDIAGYYTSANRLLMLGSHVGSSIAPALMVRASASDSSAHDLSDLRLGMRYTTILALPLFFGSLALSNALMVTAFGPTFAGTGPVLIGLAVYHIVNTYDTVTFSFFNGINQPEKATNATAIALGVLSVGSAVTVLHVGILGVVTVVVFAHMVRVLVGELMIREEFGRVVIPTSTVYQLAASVPMFFVVVGLNRHIAITGWFRLFVVVGVGAVVYSVILLTLDQYLQAMVRTVLSEALVLVGFKFQSVW
jgi:O-antigen/teichoic acid export membrane protein